MNLQSNKPVFIPFAPPLIDDDDIAEVTQCLRSGWITTGPRVEEFQRLVAQRAGTAHAVAASSCTMAMQVGLLVMGVGRGQEVITTPLTFASTAHVVKHVGAEPVFADVEEETFNIDPLKMRALIESRYVRRGKRMVNPDTGAELKAVIPVHYGGQPCDMDPIMEMAVEFNFLVLEDAAHALGASYKGRPAGSLGHAACFSFYATKNIATAEGGMLVTSNESWAEHGRRLTMYGISDARRIWGRYAPKGTWTYDVSELGLKCNFPDLLAALGVSQMRKLDRMQARRAGYAALYNRVLGSHPKLTVPRVRDYAVPAWQLYPLRLKLADLPAARNELVEKLKEAGIGTSVLFIPLHFHSYYRNLLGGHTEGMFPVSEKIFHSLINLPISPRLEREQIEYVAETLLKLVDAYE